MAQLIGIITPSATLSGVLSPSATLVGTITAGISIPTYQGEYNFTPSEDEQTINIDGMVADGNIIVNPIPNNYGLVTRVGSILTIT
jgi:hypothetical protein